MYLHAESYNNSYLNNYIIKYLLDMNAHSNVYTFTALFVRINNFLTRFEHFFQLRLYNRVLSDVEIATLSSS